MKIFNRYYTVYDFLLLLGDLVSAFLATAIVRAAYYLMNPTIAVDWLPWLGQGGVMAVLVLVSFYYSDLYVIDEALSPRELIVRLLNGFGIVCVMAGVVCFLFPALGLRDVYLSEVLLVGLNIFIWRLGCLHLLKIARSHGKILIVGARSIGKLVAEELCRQKHLGIEVVGFIGSEAGQMTLSYGNPTNILLPIFPRHSTLRVVEAKGVNKILIAESGGDFPAQELVKLRLKGVPFEDCHTFYERLMSKISIADLQQEWIALSEGFRRTHWILFSKRLVDMIVSAVGLILSAPLALLTAIAIKLDSRGPVFYRQDRTGQDERTFTLYKFRSMFQDAEAGTGPIWATENDPRVTRVGRIIRKLRIDEIPQMINVLKGEMSFVGPRPERPFFVSALKEKVPYYHLRFAVKPGITGWAQVCYPYGDSEEDAIEKLQYELYYVKHHSPIFDLQIIFETFKIIILGRGSR
ncbi:MAG: sugar transferase [Deltaproteobacteria bacterium]|nr:sugar transferase [Deltaproteobacteria bacterium]